MCTYWWAQKTATLHDLLRHATNYVRLQERSRSPVSSMREDKTSWQRSSKPSGNPSRITQVMAVREGEYSYSSPSQGKNKKRGSFFNRHNKNKESPTTVAPIIRQQRGAVNRSQGNSGFCPLRLTKGHQLEEHRVVSLQGSFFYNRVITKMINSLPRGIGHHRAVSPNITGTQSTLLTVPQPSQQSPKALVILV